MNNRKLMSGLVLLALSLLLIMTSCTPSTVPAPSPPPPAPAPPKPPPPSPPAPPAPILVMYYFAYGSNMNFEQMRKRCPKSKFIDKVLLAGYKFVYDGTSNSRKGAVANIVAHKNEAVWGGLFEIDEDCLAVLDKYEGYPNSYDRREFEVKEANGETFTAIAYFRTGRKLGEPSQQYRQIVTQGAEDCGLPKAYVERFL